MTHIPLTRRQRQILDLFRDYIDAHGISPTLEEIAQELGVNKVTVFGHVAELERKGILTRSARGISRGLQLVAAPQTLLPQRRLPVLGRIAAGIPIEVIEATEDFGLEDWLPSGGELYALKVTGDSMIDDSICDGDIVIVEKRSIAKNGETVVAVLPGEQTTLKRFYREAGGVRLQPANPAYPPILVDEVEIRGVVVGVLRRL